jgi:hypothetical protein
MPGVKLLDTILAIRELVVNTRGTTVYLKPRRIKNIIAKKRKIEDLRELRIVDRHLAFLEKVELIKKIRGVYAVTSDSLFFKFLREAPLQCIEQVFSDENTRDRYELIARMLDCLALKTSVPAQQL